jgi:hypothetical protein
MNTVIYGPIPFRSYRGIIPICKQEKIYET